MVYCTKSFHFFLALYYRTSTLSFVYALVKDRFMTDNSSDSEVQQALKPGLMGEYTDEELNEHTVKHAKYFTVVQINRGGFVRGGSNYERHQVDTLEDARVLAKELYDKDTVKRGILIYAVADFAGANGFSRPVENYPPMNYMTKGDKAKLAKKQAAEAKQKLRDARMNLGEGRITKPAAKPVETVSDAFEDFCEPLAWVTDGDD